ncbi:MAG: hypothetical protein ACTH31_09980, partial [Pseudoclavibacter sp.]
MKMHCDKCGTESPTELSRWARYYTDGETWWDTCTGCDTKYIVELRTKIVNKGATRKPPKNGKRSATQSPQFPRQARM